MTDSNRPTQNSLRDSFRDLWHQRRLFPKSPLSAKQGLRSATIGLAVIGALLLGNIVSAGVHSASMWVAVACFAVSLPLLITCGGMFDSIIHTASDGPVLLKTRQVVTPFVLVMSAYAVFVIGFIAMLWHQSIIIALLFVGCSLYCLRLTVRYCRVTGVPSSSGLPTSLDQSVAEADPSAPYGIRCRREPRVELALRSDRSRR